jgi:L-seryl-tRNA(Ser) seleniumtransferase
MGARDDTRAASAAERLRALPAVHALASGLPGPHSLAVAAARSAIDEAREQIRSGADSAPDLETRALKLYAAAERRSLRRVLNATGVIVHTNLGRAPLSGAARDAVARAATGYSNLELDLASGRRGSRHAHVERLLAALTGAEGALAVNNGAGAVLLATTALSGTGRRIIVSRGQLVEIGGGFRIPDVIAVSGATLVEVGTTNRTRAADYEQALGEDAGRESVILRVHPSNFRSLGFVEDVPIETLCGLGAPVIDDVGSGVLDAQAAGIPAFADEPTVARSIAAGAALVCCSADKLLGGPQGGILVGRADAVAAARAHPLARALRIDKLSLAALEATLALYRDPAQARREVPVLAMLDVSAEVLATRAQRLRDGIGPECCDVIDSVARVGGGALPLLELPGPAIALLSTRLAPVALMEALRGGEPPLMARVHEDQVLLDPRTLADDELEAAIAVVRGALGG